MLKLPENANPVMKVAIHLRQFYWKRGSREGGGFAPFPAFASWGQYGTVRHCGLIELWQLFTRLFKIQVTFPGHEIPKHFWKVLFM